MAELPEVHTIASDLKKFIEEYLINKVFIDPGYNTNPDNKSFVRNLVGSKIEKIGRVGKNIVMKLDSGKYLVFHLGMTGRLLLKPLDAHNDPFQKVLINLSKGDKQYSLRFCDMRMFGKASVITTKEMDNLRKKHGPDFVMDKISLEAFTKRLVLKKTTIKNALLEQSLFTGLGNIYATDALWIARVHPETKTAELTLERAEIILNSAKSLLIEGIKHRGSTLADKAYVDIFGKIGKHQNYFRIYGKSACPVCNTKVTYKKINGRGTYFCPNCQK